MGCLLAICFSPETFLLKCVFSAPSSLVSPVRCFAKTEAGQVWLSNSTPSAKPWICSSFFLMWLCWLCVTVMQRVDIPLPKHAWALPKKLALKPLTRHSFLVDFSQFFWHRWCHQVSYSIAHLQEEKHSPVSSLKGRTPAWCGFSHQVQQGPDTWAAPGIGVGLDAGHSPHCWASTSLICLNAARQTPSSAAAWTTCVFSINVSFVLQVLVCLPL